MSRALWKRFSTLFCRAWRINFSSWMPISGLKMEGRGGGVSRWAFWIWNSEFV